jgi:hypothetical protein
MHIRLQAWLPLGIQVYVNGREWRAVPIVHCARLAPTKSRSSASSSEENSRSKAFGTTTSNRGWASHDRPRREPPPRGSRHTTPASIARTSPHSQSGDHPVLPRQPARPARHDYRARVSRHLRRIIGRVMLVRKTRSQILVVRRTRRFYLERRSPEECLRVLRVSVVSFSVHSARSVQPQSSIAAFRRVAAQLC